MANNEIIIDITARDSASDVFRSVTSSARSFATGMNDNINRFNSALRGYDNAMRGFNNVVRRTFAEASRQIYSFTRDSIDNFIELERQHASTLGAMASNYERTQRGQQQFLDHSEALKQQAITLGTVGPTGQGALYKTQEVSYAQTAMVKAGIKPQDILETDVVPNVMKFAGGNDLDLNTATEFAVQLGTQFKIPMEEWGDMLDKVTYAADISIIDVKDIIESMRIGGGLPASLDRPLEEVLAMLSTMGNAGLKGFMAGTGVQAIYSRGMSPSGLTTAGVAPTQNVQDVYSEFKTLVSDQDGMFLGISNFTEQLEGIFSMLSDVEKVWFSKKLFGMFQQKAAFALGRTDMDGELIFNEMADSIMSMSGGTIDAKWELMLGSMYGNVEALKNAYEGIKTDIGGKLQPAIKEVSTQAFDWLVDPNNFEFDFTKLREAIYASGDAIAEKYGIQVGDLIKDLGDIAITGIQVGDASAPTAVGAVEAFVKLLTGHPLEAIDAFGRGIDITNEKIDKLPPELQDMAEATRNVIIVLSALASINFAAKILESITNVYRRTVGQMFTNTRAQTANVNSTTSTINTGHVTINATGSATLVSTGTVTATMAAFTGSTPLMNVTAGVVNINGGLPNTGTGGGGGGLPSGGSGLPTVIMPRGGSVLPSGGSSVPRLPAGSGTPLLPSAGNGIGGNGSAASPYTSPNNFGAAPAAGAGGAAAAASGLTASTILKGLGLLGVAISFTTMPSSGQQTSPEMLERYIKEAIESGLKGEEFTSDVMRRGFSSGAGWMSMGEDLWKKAGKPDDIHYLELVEAYIASRAPEQSEPIVPEIEIPADFSARLAENLAAYRNGDVSFKEEPTLVPNIPTSAPEVIPMMDTITQLLDNIGMAIGNFTSENLIEVTTPQPQIGLNVQVTVDQSGNVIKQSVIPNYDGYGEYIYRQTQRFGGGGTE